MSLPTSAEKYAEQAKRFWPKVEKGGEDECWPWLGSGIGHYGKMYWIPGETILAHKASYLINIGEIGKGLYVLHSCDNPRCVNPKHLSQGTQKQNMTDMITKGRDNFELRTKPIGERNGMAVLTEQQVLEVRELLQAGWLHREIADKFGVSRQAVTNISANNVWKHI